jgi:cell wall assembly regulator SMI1
MSDVRGQWKRIDTWLAAHAPPLAEDLRPPASAAQIAQAERAIGVTFPEELRASLEIHDGQNARGDGALGRWLALSCTKMKELNDELIGRMRSSWCGDDGIIADPGLRARAWHEAWIPFATDPIGDALAVDADPTPGGTLGQIIHYRHDLELRRILAPGMAAWLRELADQLERDEWEPKANGEALRRRREY